MKIPRLNTDRLKLEPLSYNHSDGMFALWPNPDVCQHSGIVEDYDGNLIQTPITTYQESDKIIDFWIKASKDGWGFRWAIMNLENPHQFMGTIGFNSLSKYHEMAYHLLPKFWGQGLMNEAAVKCVEWAHNNEADGIEAYIEPENISSVKLVNRLGMTTKNEQSENTQRYFITFRN